MKSETDFNKLQLSSVYRQEKSLGWVMVYHTRDSFSSEVEILSPEGDFFSSEEDTWAWFHSEHKAHEYVQPEAVEVIVDMSKLSIRRPAIKKSK